MLPREWMANGECDAELVLDEESACDDENAVYPDRNHLARNHPERNNPEWE